MFKIFGREPTLILQSISALLAVVVTFGLPGLSATQAALIVAALSAAVGVVNAVLVRPIAPAAFTGLVAALAALVAGYGLDVAQQTVGAVQVAVVAVLALITRNQVSPVADPQPTAREQDRELGFARPVLLASVVAVLAVIGLAVPALANGTGYCTLAGGRTNFAVYERSENWISDVTVNSVAQLAKAGSTWQTYTPDGALIDQGGFVSAPIDGDGYWNYVWSRHPNSMPNVERVRFVAKQASNGDTCVTNVYI